MEKAEEKPIKKCKKIIPWIIVGYVICVIVIISAIAVMIYKKQSAKVEPIDFATNGAVGMEANKHAYLDIQGISEEIAIFGDTDNKESLSNDRYYIAFNNGYMYIVDLNFDTIEKLKPWQDYIYSEEATEEPEPVKIYGVTEKIPDDLKQIALDFCNKDLPDNKKISMEQFEVYFGSALLNARKSPGDIGIQKLIIIVTAIVLMILIIAHIAISVKKQEIKN